FGTDRSTALSELTVSEARALEMPAGSMGPKLQAACDFAQAGGISGIGRLQDAVAILEGSAGTRVSAK
ncbi:MAG TPA: carbamate kinase, partial [Marinobacter adhaerens]|nr:carbamate kinase [Marinobacter adhaerens]HBF93428.1 carbamate kinase [Marinobacter adhaerens]